MQILVEIPDEKYERLPYIDIVSLREYIENGIPLPKGHGRLIDADALDVGQVVDGCGYRYITKYELDNALTIIEADKEV